MFRKSAQASVKQVQRALRAPVGKAVSCTGVLAFATAAAAVGETVNETDTHRAIQIPLALTNTAAGEQRVALVRATCGCVEVELEEGQRVGAGEILRFVAEYRAPFSGDGNVEERVSVTLAPSGTTVEYPVRVRVRQRLGLQPPEASFGVLGPADAGREVKIRLVGYAASETSVLGVEGGRAFAVRVGEDGRSLQVGFAGKSPHPGLYAETWKIRTGDAEIPVLKLPVWARVEGEMGRDDFGAGYGLAAGKLIVDGGKTR